MASYRTMDVAGPVMALRGSVGEGVLGPFDEVAEVKEESDPACEAIELKRGEDVLEEWAWPGGGRANEGNLSKLIYTLVQG